MAKLIILRLHPDKTVRGHVFTKYLADIEIQAFEASGEDHHERTKGK